MASELPELKNYTIVNVSNFGVSMTNDRIREMFEVYGIISSYGILNDNEGWQRFAYVAFEDSDDADEAVIELNGQCIDDNRRMRVRRTKKRDKKQIKPTAWSTRDNKAKKSDDAAASGGAPTMYPSVFRDLNLENRAQFRDDAAASGGAPTIYPSVFRDLNLENRPQYRDDAGFSVCVKNLDRALSSSQLRAAFEHCGRIIGAKIIMDRLGSRGFGFVKFSIEEQAKRAVAEMSDRLIGTQIVRVEMAHGVDKFPGPGSIRRPFVNLNWTERERGRSATLRPHDEFRNRARTPTYQPHPRTLTPDEDARLMEDIMSAVASISWTDDV